MNAYIVEAVVMGRHLFLEIKTGELPPILRKQAAIRKPFESNSRASRRHRGVHKERRLRRLPVSGSQSGSIYLG